METKKNKPKVIVCGAGIGGMTAAHELVRRGFEVTVYERNSIVGGLARSKYHTQNNYSYPVEYSWRVYGNAYKNMHRVLSEIPLSGNKSKSVFDNLVYIFTYIFPRFDKEEFIIPHEKGKPKLITSIPLVEKWKILNKIFYCSTMSESRMDSLDNLKWADFCEDLSEEAKKYVVRIWGPVLGMDPTYMSFPVVARMVKVLLGGYSGRASSLYVMDKPTNRAWFDEWVVYLESLGARIKTEIEVIDFNLAGGEVASVVLKDKKSGREFSEDADYVVCGLSLESVAKITEENQKLMSIEEFANAVPLAKKCKQVQLSAQIFLSKKLVYPTKEKNVLYLPDAPWAIIIEPEDLIWEDTYCSDPKVKSVLSVGICQTDVPGILHKKPFTKCTLKEIEEEVWAQMVKSYHASNIKTEDGDSLDKAEIILFYIWDSFSFNKETREIEIWEPKFSNNIGSLHLQPEVNTTIPNLYFATGYTKTDRFIYSMESATEAGVRCANLILKKEGLDGGLSPVYSTHTQSLLFRPLAFLDKLLFKIGLPHLSRFTFGSSVIPVVLYVVLIVIAVLVLFEILT